jgi:peptide/nickel transport system ATP-binding protein
MRAMAAVDVSGLAVAFPDRGGGWLRVVDGVDLHVEDSETMGVVGESGCGKSLTMLALGGLVPAPARTVAGRIVIQGTDVRSASTSELDGLRGAVLAYVFQEPSLSLNPVRSVGFQVTEAARLHRQASRAEARRMALELVREVGLTPAEPILRAYPHQLSGGQRQRVMLAAALSAGPRVLLADEPTSALDTTAQADFIDLLRRVRESREMAMVFVSHDLGLVMRVAERTTVLYAGETVEVAATADLFREPLHPYSRLMVRMMTAERPDTAAPLPTIPGRVPPPVEWRRGCRFAARCPAVQERCRAARPALSDLGEGRSVRCFLHCDEEEQRG